MRDLLTVCVLARNEEGWLADCLRSTDVLGASLVVLDCGSVDGTDRIARSFTDRVVPFPWDGDFAAARNRLLAEAATPWVLMLDADERLTSKSTQTVADVLANLDLRGVSLPVFFYDGLGLVELARQPRLFRREGAHYQGKIAETAVFPTSRWSFFPDPGLLEVHNFGHYGDAFRRRGSGPRNTELLDQELAEARDPERRSLILWRLGGEWLRFGSFPQAAACFRLFGQGNIKDGPYHLMGSLGFLESLLRMERFNEVLETADRLLAERDDLKVAWSRKAHALNRLGRHVDAKTALHHGLAAHNCLTWSGAESAAVTYQLWYDLGVTLSQLGELPGAMYAFLKLQAEAPNWQGPFHNERMALRLLLEAGALAEVKLAFRELSAKVPGIRSALLEDIAQMGQPDLALDLLTEPLPEEGQGRFN